MTNINVKIEEPKAINIQITEGEIINVNINEGVASILSNIFTALEEGKQITKIFITDDNKVAIEFENN